MGLVGAGRVGPCTLDRLVVLGGASRRQSRLAHGPRRVLDAPTRSLGVSDHVSGKVRIYWSSTQVPTIGRRRPSGCDKARTHRHERKTDLLNPQRQLQAAPGALLGSSMALGCCSSCPASEAPSVACTTSNGSALELLGAQCKYVVSKAPGQR